MARRNNRIVCDLNKAQWVKYYYQNQYGNIVYKVPCVTTVFGEAVDEDAKALFHADYPNESQLARAYRLKLVDVWTPTLVIKFSANETLYYTGDKAKSLFKAWNAKIYGNKKP